MRQESTKQLKTVRTKHGKKRARGKKQENAHEKDTSRSPRSGPQRHTTSSNCYEFTKTFLDLPAELRNEVYMLSLPDNEVVDIAHGLPSLLVAHEQIHDEALPILLSRNTFQVVIRDRRDAALRVWLDLVKGLPAEHKASIKEVRIAFEGRTLHTKNEKYDDFWEYEPGFEHWNAFITPIIDAGLMAKQVRWLGLRPESFTRLPFDDKRGRSMIEAFLLNRFILNPLLKHRGFHHPSTRPVDIQFQLHKTWQALGLSWKEGAFVLHYLALGAFGEGRSKVHFWFENWVAESASAEGSLKMQQEE